MAKKPDDKVISLKKHGALNPRPESVTDELFYGSDFFDPRDLVQVKYEMLRRVKKDGQSVTEAAKSFGFSRPTFYQVQEVFDKEGLPGLLPHKRGPQKPHKLNQEVMDFILELLKENRSLSSRQLAERVEAKFGFTVHPRSIERGLERRKKNTTTRSQR